MLLLAFSHTYIIYMYDQTVAKSAIYSQLIVDLNESEKRVDEI